MNLEKTITDLGSLVKIVLEANNRFDGQVWWRGQRDISWGLTPSILRQPHDARSETNLISRFMQKALSRHPKTPSSGDYSSWLFLMQHYRLPTRLLDWTESPVAALYFASEIDPASKSHPKTITDNDGALFAISPYQLNENQTGNDKLYLPSDPPTKKLIRAAFLREESDSMEVVALRPSEVDLRLMVQLSVFTLHGSGRLLEDIKGYEKFTLKYKIPTKSKQEIRSQLKQLEIRGSSLFPDLEHLADDVSSTRYKETNKAKLKNSPYTPGFDIRDYGESST